MATVTQRTVLLLEWGLDSRWTVSPEGRTLMIPTCGLLQDGVAIDRARRLEGSITDDPRGGKRPRSEHQPSRVAVEVKCGSGMPSQRRGRASLVDRSPQGGQHGVRLPRPGATTERWGAANSAGIVRVKA